MNREKYDFKYSLKTYLYMLGKSRALNYIKRERNVVLLNEEEQPVDEDIENIVFENERIANLKEAINKLPKKQQVAIYLADIEELSYKEICKILNKTLSEVKMVIYRGRKNLKEILLKEREKYYE